jgi:predicted RNA-binding Zn ribbon-like protein
MGFDLGTEAAPGQLEHVRQFVNTLDVETGTDELDAPAKLASWLAERDLLDARAEVGEAELRRAIELREALRMLLLANNGAALDGHAIETLNRIASGAKLSVRFDPQGSPALAVKSSGPGAAVAPIVAVVYEAMANGTWSRLKACRADDCQWAFYDRSRNRSGTWCDMAVCGNRAKARAYRDRHARDRRRSPNPEAA